MSDFRYDQVHGFSVYEFPPEFDGDGSATPDMLRRIGYRPRSRDGDNFSSLWIWEALENRFVAVIQTPEDEYLVELGCEADCLALRVAWAPVLSVSLLVRQAGEVERRRIAPTLPATGRSKPRARRCGMNSGAPNLERLP
jgi:hypothetical protein